ncbi:unnamed protein product [Rotaria sp. Silwood1]|nr:unnamed protein product [Rotaria sp. Silwood1]
MNITTTESENLVVFKRVIEGYILSCVCIIGLIGNSITCLSILLNRVRHFRYENVRQRHINKNLSIDIAAVKYI